MKRDKIHIEELKKGTNPLRAPEDFFANNAHVLKDITRSHTQEPTVIRPLRKVIIGLAVAASIMAAAIFLIPSNTSSELTSNDILLLVDAGYLDFENTTLAYLDVDQVDMELYNEEEALNYLNEQDLYYLEEDLLLDY